MLEEQRNACEIFAISNCVTINMEVLLLEAEIRLIGEYKTNKRTIDCCLEFWKSIFDWLLDSNLKYRTCYVFWSGLVI